MTDKERLKEIDLNKTYNECGITGDLLSIELKPNDYYDLLEQAERVQELEEEVERYQSGRNIAVITKMKMDVIQERNERLEKQVQELEELVEGYKIELMIKDNAKKRARQRNRRYRKALEAIYELAEYDEYNNTLEQIVSEVEKALKEDNEPLRAEVSE